MIQKLTGFDIITSDVIDSRFHKTKEEMKATIDALTPSPYPNWCPDDGLMYIYNVNNPVDGFTGKYKLFEGGDASGVTYSAGTAIVIDSANTISVVVSSVGNNQLIALPDGLYVSAETVSYSGSDSINIDSANTISVNVSEVGNNALKKLSDGLYMSAETISYSGSNTVNIDSANTISANVSHIEGNILSALTDGLYASAETISYSGSNTVDIDSAHTVTVKVSKAEGNIVSAMTDGIYVSAETISYSGSDTIDIDSANTITTKISQIEGNILSAMTDGLYASAITSTNLVSANTGVESGEVLSSITIDDKSYLIQDKVGDLSALTTSAQSCAVSAINEVMQIILEDERIHASAMCELNEHIGVMSALTTEEKYSLVDAINELNEKAMASGGTLVSGNTGVESAETLTSITIDHKDYLVSGGDAVMPSGFTTNITVGGIASGTEIKTNESLAKIIKDMLWKYKAPTATLTLSPTTAYYNILTSSGDTTITLKGSYVAGTNPEPYTENYYGNGTEITTESKTYKTNNTTGTANTHGNLVNTLRYTVNDGKTTVPAEKTVSYIYPKYYGLSATIGTTPTADEVIGNTSIVLDVNKAYSPAGKAGYNVREVYAYLKSYGALTSILNPSNFEYLSSFTRSEVTINGKAYYVYVANTAHTIESTYKMRFI